MKRAATASIGIEIFIQRLGKDKMPENITPIEKLDIWKRTIKLLKKNGIHTIGQLVTMEWNDFKRIKGLGRKQFNMIRDAYDSQELPHEKQEFNQLHLGKYEVIWEKSLNPSLTVKDFAEHNIIPALHALLYMKTKKFWRISISIDEV